MDGRMVTARTCFAAALLLLLPLGRGAAEDLDPRDLFGRYEIVSAGSSLSFSPRGTTLRRAAGTQITGRISIFQRRDEVAISVGGEARFFGGETGTRFGGSLFAGSAGRTGRAVDAWLDLGGRTIGDARFGRVSFAPKALRITDARYVFADGPNQPGQSARLNVKILVLQRDKQGARVIRLEHVAYRDTEGNTRAVTLKLTAKRAD